MIRFLHVADLHLGMRITRFSETAVDRVREARFEALERIGAEAARGDYQFVLMAGDLFDDVRIQREIARRAFSILEEFAVPVLIIPGNHDPLEPGAVWDVPPWNGDQTRRVHLLREPAPCSALDGVTLFPCPVFRKTSYDDPTQWIAQHPRSADQGFRIGMAHGSVMDRPNLPEDDHPISPDAPAALDLDYLALGHWHRPKRYADNRMAYPGVHEPMRFSDGDVSGWKPYSPGGDREEFCDDGEGRAYAVTIEQPGSPPQIEEIPIGRLKWESWHETIHDEAGLDAMIRRVVDVPSPELKLLRLELSGTLPLGGMERVEELRQVLGRFVVGQLTDDELHVEPTEDEIRDAVGGGILKSVFDRLHAAGEAAGDSERQAVVERSLSLLYRYANKAGERA